MKVLVLPRDRGPYQSLLYRELDRLGVRAIYLCERTPSKTLNLLLLPFEVAVWRMAGARVVHLHWVFAFSLPWAERLPALRRLSYLWFLLWLSTCRWLGVRLVWTAHNVLPHEPVFPDDAGARRALTKAADLVLAHSITTIVELEALGAIPRRTAVVPHGPITPEPSSCPLRTPGTGPLSCHFLFFGRVKEYKGVEDLLLAFNTLPREVEATLTVAGRCDDPSLRSRLEKLVATGPRRVELCLQHVADAQVPNLLSAADVVVLPFREITTSGSAMLALAHGRPLIVPDMATLKELPDDAVLRHQGGVAGLRAALIRLAGADPGTLAAMSQAAVRYALATTWPDIAEMTESALASLLGPIRYRSAQADRTALSEKSM